MGVQAVVDTRFAKIGDLQLDCGRILPDVQIAYVTLGERADNRPVVLLVHGYTSPHYFALPGAPAAEGSWEELVGPGRAIDTDRFFVVSSNMLGSSFGSTGPRDLNPATGRPYGPDFPSLTLSDIVRAQRKLLDQLGISQLAAVAGPSYGGFQALQWAIDYPDQVGAIVVAVSGLNAPPGVTSEGVRAGLSQDPNWNGGWYYDQPGGIATTLAEMREKTLRAYCVEESLKATLPLQADRDARIREMAQAWAAQFDGHSLIALATGLERFNPSDADLARIRAKVLLMQADSDLLFPAAEGEAQTARLRGLGVRAEFFGLQSAYGHLASGHDAKAWAPVLARFMADVPEPAC